MLRAAWVAPEMFQTGVMRAHLFPVRPRPPKWEALLAVSFPVPLGETGGAQAEREFGAVLSAGSKMVYKFSRRITLQPNNPGVTSEPVITFLERVELRPGTYTLTAVLSDPSREEAHSATIEVEIPEIVKPISS